MSASRKILIGLGAGIVTGLVLGELVAPLTIVAEGFVRLLQMTVLPYVTISIISSLGALTHEQARVLGLRGGAVILTLWAIAFGITFVMPLAFPPAVTASFFSTTLIEPQPAFDFVGLYIPANPFNALANSIVPAVVLFSVILGVALIGVERKQVLLDVLQTATSAISRATRAVVSLTPYGLFAIAAVAAGTLTIEQLQRIQIYLLTYVAIALIVALWVLPGLIMALTGIRIIDVFRKTRDSLIVAFVAGDLFIVLPGLIDACKALLLEHKAENPAPPGEEHHALETGPDVIVPVSFNFPHTGKLLSLSFIPFAAWFADAPLRLVDYPQLFGAGLLSFFGSLNSAVPFLLNLFHLPADTFQLFLATGVINSRFGTLVAAMHTVTVAVVGSLALTGAMHLHFRRIVRFGIVTAVVVVGTIGGLRTLFSTVLAQQFAGADLLYSMQPLLGQPPGTLSTALPSDSAATGGQTDGLETLRARGVLRVAVLPERMPFAFENRQGQLIGLDIELAQTLAADLGVEVAFFKIDDQALPDALMDGVVDMAMSGVVISPERATSVLFSAPYVDETLAFVMPDHLRDHFTDWSTIRELGAIRVAMPNSPAYIRVVKARAPNVEIVPLNNFNEIFARDDVAAYVLPAERGSVLTLLNPAYSVVVPRPDTIKLPIAIGVARRDERWAAFINTWLELKRRDGTIDALYRHWILGQQAAPRTPRWSVIHNVLGWM